MHYFYATQLVKYVAVLLYYAPTGLRVGICQIFYKHTTPSGFSMVEWKHGGYNNCTPSGLGGIIFEGFTMKS